MCIIVYNRKGASLDKEQLRIAYENNPHGYGLMWHDGDRVLTLKEHESGFDSLWSTLQKFSGQEYALHLRWRTRGADTRAQCHPHRVTSKDNGAPSDLFLMHNGTMQFKRHKVKSDTKLFAEKLRMIMKGSDFEFLTALKQMKSHVTTIDKLLFMNSDGEVKIVNEDKGSWIDGVWYSNIYSFEPGYRKASTVFCETSYTEVWDTTSGREDYWNDTRPVKLLRGTASGKTKTPVGYVPAKYRIQQQAQVRPTLSKKKAKKLAKIRKRKLLKAASVAGKEQQEGIKRSSLPPGRHFDSRGNLTLVTNSGAVLRVR